MNVFKPIFKPKRVPKLGDSLKGTVERKFLWRAIDAGRVGEIFKELSKKIEELEDCRMVSWREGKLKIKVGSSVQRQEIILNQKKLKEEMKKKGVELKEIKVIF